MAKAKEFKPSKKFLQKVADGDVANTFKYSPRTGGQHGFRGGEKTYEAHLKAGYVNRAPSASMGHPGVVTLTDKGRAILDADKAAAADCREPIVQGQRCPACASWSVAKIVTGTHGQNRECPDCTAQWTI